MFACEPFWGVRIVIQHLIAYIGLFRSLLLLLLLFSLSSSFLSYIPHLLMFWWAATQRHGIFFHLYCVLRFLCPPPRFLLSFYTILASRTILAAVIMDLLRYPHIVSTSDSVSTSRLLSCSQNSGILLRFKQPFATIW